MRKKVLLITVIIYVLCGIMGNSIVTVSAEDTDSSVDNQVGELVNSDTDSINVSELAINTDNKTESSVFLNFVFPVLVEFFSAFLGIFLAAIITSKKSNKQFVRMEEILVDELVRIKNELAQVIESDEYVFQYVTTNWDIYLESGGLTCFYSRKRNKKKNSAEYTRIELIIKTYYSIAYAKKLEENYYNMLRVDEKNQRLMNYCRKVNKLRKQEMKIIYDSINEIKGVINSAGK